MTWSQSLSCVSWRQSVMLVNKREAVVIPNGRMTHWSWWLLTINFGTSCAPGEWGCVGRCLGDPGIGAGHLDWLTCDDAYMDACGLSCMRVSWYLCFNIFITHKSQRRVLLCQNRDSLAPAVRLGGRSQSCLTSGSHFLLPLLLEKPEQPPWMDPATRVLRPCPWKEFLSPLSLALLAISKRGW